MKIPPELIEGIIQNGIKEKWEYFKNLDSYNGYEEDMDLVKNGIDILFDIRYMFVDTNEIKVKDKEGKVLINGKTYDRQRYWDELDNREKIMVEAIYKSIEQKSILHPRD